MECIASVSAAQAPSGRRYAWVGRARGFGILLVVLGHVLGGLEASGIVATTDLSVFVHDWIYAFHMPLFFALSGYLATSTQPWLDLARSKLRTIAYPYVVWSLLQTALQSALGSLANHPIETSAVLRLAYAPVMQFWFLYVLFVLSLAYGAGQALRLGPLALLGSTLLLRIAAAGGGLGSWGVLYQVAEQAPYFALGAALRPRWEPRLQRLSGRWALLLTLPSLVLLTALVLDIGPQLPLRQESAAVVGMLAVALLAHGNSHGWWARTMERCGQLSLQIFVAHTMAAAAVRILLQRGLGVEEASLHLVLGVTAGMLGPVLLNAGLERVGCEAAFRWPSRRAAKNDTTVASSRAALHSAPLYTRLPDAPAGNLSTSIPTTEVA